MRPSVRAVEWPTLGMLVLTYLVWGIGTTLLWQISPLLAVVVTGIAIAQYSSLQHEVLHGHPFANARANEALVFAAITLFVPYRRFRDTHLDHHIDPNLTDPYEDPESNFMEPAVWLRLSRVQKLLLTAHNTLVGRVVLGPAISVGAFVLQDIAAIRAGAREVRAAWALHAIGLVPVVTWLLTVASMPFWAYLLAAYVGFGLLKIRTYCEHRAHEMARARTVLIEDRGPLALLFLNNNLHAVHHCSPSVAWYDLPKLYAEKREQYLQRNEGYVFSSYAQVFREYLFKAKDPVPHPLWPLNGVQMASAASDAVSAKPAKGRNRAGVIKKRRSGLVNP